MPPWEENVKKKIGKKKKEKEGRGEKRNELL